MTIALRPLTTGELLDCTFSLYKEHFLLFVGIVALPHLISLALQLGGVAFRSQTGVAAALGMIGWALLTLFASLIVGAASQAATVVAVSQLHLARPTSVSEAFSRVKGRIFAVVFLSFVVGLGVGLATLLLIVPGIICAMMWSLAVPVMVLEDKDIGESMSRSAELTKGSRWRVFVIWILFIVLSVAVSMLIEYPIRLVGGVAVRSQTATLGNIQVASAVAGFLTQCLVGPLATIAFSLLYYDQRVRKEAFDLQLMMETLDGTQAGVAAP